MKVQLNTDSNIQGDEALAEHVQNVVDGALERFAQVSRVEVHLSDVNAGKSGDNDKRCIMEARVDGHQPVVASEDAPTVRGAIGGSVRKLQRVLDSTFGKIGH